MKAAVIAAVGLEALMGTKDKGGRSNRKTAAKDLKQKRLDKKAKKDESKKNKVV